ncbi:MAG: hypothetical protein ACD_20C00099G0002 [uncultured bacterium]|nr:MAG: hypothetical protein ACD_20C00099G0002 [uncultured bacterium]HBH18493.1 hypothetical protein [Cyanobacteria bacterium UBA9579]
MNISFKEAFTYFFKDKTWKYKLPIFTIFLYALYLFYFLGKTSFLFKIGILILLIFICGYLALLAHNLISKKDEILPDFSFQKILLSGFKYYSVTFSYIFLIFAISIIWFILYHYFSKDLGYILAHMSLISSFYFKATIAVAGIIRSKILLWTILSVIIFVSLMFFLIAITAFSQRLNFKDSFNLKRLINIFKYAHKEYLFIFSIMGIGIILVFMVPHTQLFSDNQLGILVLSIIISIIQVPIILVWQHLLCQAYNVGVNKMQELNDVYEY